MINELSIKCNYQTINSASFTEAPTNMKIKKIDCKPVATRQHTFTNGMWLMATQLKFYSPHMYFVLYNMQVHCLAIVIYSGIPWVLPIMLLASGVSPALHTHSKEQKHLCNVIVFVKVLMYSHDCFPWLYALKYYLTMTVMCVSIL